MPGPEEIVVKISNLEFGGLRNGGRDHSARLLEGADLALVQELWAEDPDDEASVWREFRELADLAGLAAAAIGQPRGEAKLRTGIMTNPDTFEVVRSGPALSLETPYWTEITLRARNGTELDAYSIHAPASNAPGQLQEAGRLTSRIARHPRRAAVAGGDWNCYSSRDSFTPQQMEALPRHLWPSRLCWDGNKPEGSPMTPAVNLDVEKTLLLGDLVDPVPLMPPGQVVLTDPPGTGSEPVGIIDRMVMHSWMVPAMLWHRQVDNPGADHKQLWYGMNLTRI